jgi:adenylate cyclase
VLLEVSQLLSTPVELDALLERIVDLAFQILDVDRGALLTADGPTAELAPRVVRGAGSKGGPFHSTSVVGWVRSTGAAGLFSDVRNDPRVVGAVSVIAQSICSSMCAPLRGRDGLLGVLYVDNVTTPGRFGSEDLEFLGAFASQAALAIDAARLRQRLEHEAVVRSNFLRFFPPAAMRRIEEAGGEILGAIETEVTALFADISGFTELSSNLQPRQVVDLLNAYFPVMSDIVFRNEGTLEKYIGDALMAVWGAPFPHEDDADRAVLAAVEMQRAMRGLSLAWHERLGRPVAIHIGLNTGPVAAGNIGSETYIQYATVGDATNVAARLCGAAAAGEILISEQTRARLRNVSCPLVPLPPVSVKGKSKPISVCRLDWEG